MERSGTGYEGVRAVILDAVGTLIDPAPSVAEVYAGAARRQGLEVETGEVRRRFKEHFRRDELDDLRGPMVTDESIEYRRWRRIVGGVLPGLAEPDRAFLELWEHFGRPDAWRCFDDVIPAVGLLREAGLAVRVGSNFDGRLRQVLRGLPGLEPLADSVVISSEVGYRKPHPSFYRAACDRLELPPPVVLSVGDDPENDDAGARRAGLSAALIDRSGRVGPRPGVFPDLVSLAAAVVG
ncbi:HAD family hydrolase [Tautonia plasticadhaerens]|uniref:Flavin mononucleotide phosphatase n=1 Tax=Tautonia plasticadhaerens TaxID=2527974 RepID=A0A518HBI3_9BACT|nr:HAD family hydrolase [Tautonia plasticadhaerens]QDV38191.1 flavin mononucleotide phosphatase [Tautonia plasticadhaerens]